MAYVFGCRHSASTSPPRFDNHKSFKSNLYFLLLIHLVFTRIAVAQRIVFIREKRA